MSHRCRVWSCDFVFQDATDPAPAPTSGPSCSDRTSPESLALSVPAAVTFSSTCFSICSLLLVWHAHPLRPKEQASAPSSSSTSFSGSTARPLATTPQDLLILLLLFSVPCGLRCLPSRGSSAHQPATSPSSPHQPPTAAADSDTRRLPHHVQTSDVDHGLSLQHRSWHAGVGSGWTAAAEQLCDGEIKH